MHLSLSRTNSFVATFILASLAFAGTAIASDAKWEGTYAQQSDDKMTLVIQADHKGTMSSDGVPADVTWEVSADDKIIVHMMAVEFPFFRTADGNLRDGEGVVWKKSK